MVLISPSTTRTIVQHGSNLTNSGHGVGHLKKPDTVALILSIHSRAYGSGCVTGATLPASVCPASVMPRLQIVNRYSAQNWRVKLGLKPVEKKPLISYNNPMRNQ